MFLCRSTESTRFEKWAPIQQFQTVSKIPFDTEDAGRVITYFSRKMNMWNSTRPQIQAFFGFAFFDDCCWNCASPFHHRAACSNHDEEIKSLCKLLHDNNHPPSAATAAKKKYFRER